MKNLDLSFSKKKQIPIWLAVTFLLFSSCHEDVNENADYDEILKNTKINPEFEKSPPIAKNLAIEILKEPLKSGENLRVVAEFSESRPSDKFLGINLNDQKAVLRDDGKGADLRANDNKFSIFIKEDIEELKKELRKKQKALLSEDENFVFKNRIQIPIDRKSIESFDIESIDLGNLIEIPQGIILGIVSFIDPTKTLMITDPSVIQDPARTFNPNDCSGNPNGVWSFGELMRQMASPNLGSIATDAQVSEFVMNWLSTWLVDQTINGDQVFRREELNDAIIEPWLSISEDSGAPEGQLNMEFAPFELEAIVNRMDLRGNSGYGFSNAGEGRFIFRLHGPHACDGFFDPNLFLLQGTFLIILEYGINKKSCSSVKEFAQQWADLNDLTIGSESYNAALEAITLQFTQSETNPLKPNQSSINQIRTNENGFQLGWQLREYNLNASGQLELVTIQMEPALKYNAINFTISSADVNRLASYVNSMTGDIENNNYVVPEQIPLTPGTTSPTTGFLGGSAFSGVSPEPDQYWDGTSTPGSGFINSDEARHIFSLNTCSGCHAKETNTNFLHLGTSGFLNGITVVDPANRPSGSPTSRTFNDLLRRKNDLNNLINNGCKPSLLVTKDLMHKLTFEPIRMVH